MQALFLEILNVESQPTVDDYLPLISTVQDINQIWEIITLIIQLAVEQNKQVELRGKEVYLKKKEKRKFFFNIEKYHDIAFIPCMGNQKKLVKYTDHPLYPHDSDIADLFVDMLPIIKLPGNFEEELDLIRMIFFCSRFEPFH